MRLRIHRPVWVRAYSVSPKETKLPDNHVVRGSEVVDNVRLIVSISVALLRQKTLIAVCCRRVLVGSEKILTGNRIGHQQTHLDY